MEENVKAIIYKKYGPPEVLQIKEVEKPIPKDNEVLIRNYATTVSAADYRMRSFSPPTLFWIPARIALGIFRPKRTILGWNLAGKIEAIGKHVTLFEKGDEVFASTGESCGAYVEYKCLPENGRLALIPKNMSYEQATAIPFGALTALTFLRDMGNIQSGQKVLIYGASGAVGTAAVQLAKYFGAEVTGVCSATNLALVKSLRADKVIDYTKQDFTKSNERYDMIFDTVGKCPVLRAKQVLKQHGKLLFASGGLRHVVQMIWTSLRSGKKVLLGNSVSHVNDFIFIAKLMEAGEIIPVIDRRYTFEQIVEAHRYADKEHKKGNVVITLGWNNQSS